MTAKKLVSLLICSVMIFLLSFAAGCAGDKAAQETASTFRKPIVAVTIVPERTFVEAVCLGLAEVITMVPPGYSPENYEPTPAEMEKFNDASLYFSIGVQTEEANILPNAGDVRVISLRDEVSKVCPERNFESGERDPHIWLSPKRVKVMVLAIAREMSALDPANQEIYNKNANEYISQLDEADAEIKAALAGVENKKFVVYHPAFGYFAEDYGLEMFALEEEGKEATPQHLQKMIDLAKAENIKVIFYQEEIDSSQSAAYAEEIGGKAMQLSPLSADYINNAKAMAEIMAEVMQ